MPQTLIAIGALAITITFALSTQRAELDVDRSRIHGEVQMLAGQVGVDMLAHISAQHFDFYTETGTTIDDEDDLTPQPFETGKDISACNDVDDFHQMAPYQRSVVVGSAIPMDIAVTVQYVDVDGAYSADQTFQKEVTVSVQDAPGPHGRILREPVVISEIITYP